MARHCLCGVDGALVSCFPMCAILRVRNDASVSARTSTVVLNHVPTSPFIHSVRYCAPFNADAVLVIDPVRNTTDSAALPVAGMGREKWSGLAFSTLTQKIYFAAHASSSNLIVDPVEVTIDVTTLEVNSRERKWSGVDVDPATNLLVAAPANASSAAVIGVALDSPVCTVAAAHSITTADSPGTTQAQVAISTLTSAELHEARADGILTPVIDSTTFGVFPPNGTKWSGNFAFVPSTGKLYAPNYRASTVLVVDPVRKVADSDGIGGLPSGQSWSDFGFAPNVNKL